MQSILNTLLFKEFISPCDGEIFLFCSILLFLQFIFLDKCFSGEFVFQLVNSAGGEESSTLDKNRFGEEEEYSSFSWKKLVVAYSV